MGGGGGGGGGGNSLASGERRSSMSSMMLGGVAKALARRSFRASVESLRGEVGGRMEKAGAGASGAGDAGGMGERVGAAAGASMGDAMGVGEAMGCSGCAAAWRTAVGGREEAGEGAIGVGTMGGGRVVDSMGGGGSTGEVDGMEVGAARGEERGSGGVKGVAWMGDGEVGAMGISRGGAETRRGAVESVGMEAVGGMMPEEVEMGLLGIGAETVGVSREDGRGGGGRTIVSGERRSSMSSTMLGGVAKAVARRSLADEEVESLRGGAGGGRGEEEDGVSEAKGMDGGTVVDVWRGVTEAAGEMEGMDGMESGSARGEERVAGATKGMA